MHTCTNSYVFSYLYTRTSSEFPEGVRGQFGNFLPPLVHPPHCVPALLAYRKIPRTRSPRSGSRATGSCSRPRNGDCGSKAFPFLRCIPPTLPYDHRASSQVSACNAQLHELTGDCGRRCVQDQHRQSAVEPVESGYVQK